MSVSLENIASISIRPDQKVFKADPGPRALVRIYAEFSKPSDPDLVFYLSHGDLGTVLEDLVDHYGRELEQIITARQNDQRAAEEGRNV